MHLSAVVYLEALHQKQSPALRAALEADGGCPLHIDAKIGRAHV